MSMWGRRDEGWHNPHRLYRDTENARVSGVCAGIADFFGIRRRAIRIAAILCLVFFFVPTVLTYIVLTIVLPKKPPALYASREEEVFWRGVSTAPDDTLRSIRHKFDLHRKFRDIGG